MHLHNTYICLLSICLPTHISISIVLKLSILQLFRQRFSLFCCVPNWSFSVPRGDLRVDLDIKQHASIENISPSPEVAEAEAKMPRGDGGINGETSVKPC